MAVIGMLAAVSKPNLFLGASNSQLQSTNVFSYGSALGCGNVPRRSVRCMAAATELCDQSPTRRRSANYHATIWSNDYIQSLTSDFTGEKYRRRSNELKEQVKIMLDKVVEPLVQLEMIDNLQRLGVSYHFKVEIKRILESIYNNYIIDDKRKIENLYATALEFRLLRQHGYNVSQEIFNCFKNEKGNFKPSLIEDTKGMLYLYEATYLSIEGESTLDMAKEFTTKHLRQNLLQNMDLNLAIMVNHALDIPLHWRMLRLEARWFIDLYERGPNTNPILLEFAKLDFNMVQTIHQNDIKHSSEWWKSTCLGEKLSFARDRIMEDFIWTIGLIFEPEYGYCRRMITKLVAFIGIVDDVYDIYGSLDELELFTDAVERWDLDAMEQLPEYMKICFLALYNSINEMAYDVLKEQGSNITSYLAKAWADLCKAYLQEAKWYYSGYTPTLEEYMNNGWISITGPVLLIHGYFFVTNPITKEALKCLDNYQSYYNLIRWASVILRLEDDLGTASDELKRGDVPKSIQCYMNETGASEEDARKHIRFLISETWKKLNEDRVKLADSPFSETFVGIALNLQRMARRLYEHGDGHGIENLETEDLVLSLLIDPIPFV